MVKASARIPGNFSPCRETNGDQKSLHLKFLGPILRPLCSFGIATIYCQGTLHISTADLYSGCWATSEHTREGSLSSLVTLAFIFLYFLTCVGTNGVQLFLLKFLTQKYFLLLAFKIHTTLQLLNHSGISCIGGETHHTTTS